MRPQRLQAVVAPGGSPAWFCAATQPCFGAFETVIWPKRASVLEVRGRRSGRTISFPVVIADYEGERYLVSMLDKDANWVRNVQAAGGVAVLCHGGREDVGLEEVPVDARPAILRRYLAVPGGTWRWHRGLVPTFRSIAMPHSKSSRG
jgi:hypothetical protein